MPHMLDASFEHTLIYLCDHDERGALGIIVNRTLAMNLSEVFEQMEIEIQDPQIRHRPVYEGGPVDPTHGLVIHPPEDGKNWNGTQRFNEHICISSSRDVLEDIANGKGPVNYLVTLGHAGWGPGQLEEELGANAWLTCPADTSIFFTKPVEQRLDKAAALLGIDLSNLSSETGHA